MALFTERKPETESEPAFKRFAAADVDSVFLNVMEHADLHLVDGKPAKIIMEEDSLKPHNAHWEAGAKQSFDSGLYTAHTILYIRVEDYGPKPKVNKPLVLDGGTKLQRTFAVISCEDERGIYRMKLERTRQ